jgi:hypothetical protein
MHDPARPEASEEDLYVILGVPPTASTDAIRHAYRLLARSNHPDVTDAPAAARGFARLAAAYEVLGDPERRRTYDRTRREIATSAPVFGVSAVHRAPAPSWNPAVRGRDASRRPADRAPAAVESPQPPRSSADEWRLASALAKALAVVAVVMIVGLSAMVFVTATSNAEPEPVPTIYCKTPNGWMDCRRAIDPTFP